MRSVRLFLTASILLLGLAVTAAANAQPGSGNGNGNSNAAHTTDSGTCEGLRGRFLRDCEAEQQALTEAAEAEKKEQEAAEKKEQEAAEKKEQEAAEKKEQEAAEKGKQEESASGGSVQHCEINYGGQYHVVGSVCVTIDDETLTLDYIMEDGWTINEAHAWVGDDLASMPQTGNGNPIPGLFPYTTTTSDTDVITFVMNISDLNLNIDTYCESGLYVAAHGVVSGTDGHGTETSWAGEIRFTERGNWATYFGVSDPCRPEDDEDEDDEEPIEACYDIDAVPIPGEYRQSSLIGRDGIGEVGGVSMVDGKLTFSWVVGGDENWGAMERREVDLEANGMELTGTMKLCETPAPGPS